MTEPLHPPREKSFLETPIRDLKLAIAGTPLEPVLAEFVRELDRAGIHKLRPHFYLSTEWGVPFDTISLAIPFYLARQDLTTMHAEQAGHLEGAGRGQLLRYLRHEMGHVVNYAYRLYEREDWINQFGSITQPYEEVYHPEPFNRRFVVHLPGWYAQKHPDEDWAETFAVWLTPGLDWRGVYADWPAALAKLEYCARTMAEVGERDPVVTAIDPDEDIGDLHCSLADYYKEFVSKDEEKLPPGLDGALRAIFEDQDQPEDASTEPRRPAAGLIRKLELDLNSNIYRWTGHFPERTRDLLRQLALRAEQLRQVYPADRETSAVVALTTLVTALAMNHVFRGSYIP